jgi:hypothetical protein
VLYFDQNREDKMETMFLPAESEIFYKLVELAEQCESWWACVGSLAAGVSAPLWRIALEPGSGSLSKLQYAVIGLNPRFGDLYALRRLHEQGALRVVLPAEGLFEPNVYAFRMGQRYVAMIISGFDAPLMFGQDCAAAVLVDCPEGHQFALGVESFLYRCLGISRLVGNVELASLENRMGFEDEAWHFQIPDRNEASAQSVKRADADALDFKCAPHETKGPVTSPERIPSYLKALTKRNEIRQAYESFRKLMMNGSETFWRNVGFQGGNEEIDAHWHPAHGIWCHMTMPSWGDRYWCIFGFQNPSEIENLDITCEINFPFEGIDRRVAGAFALDQDGKTCIVHSGKIGGGRKGIGKTAFWNFCGSRGQVVTISWPDRKESDGFLVGYLDDEKLVERISSFVGEVRDFKEQVIGAD